MGAAQPYATSQPLTMKTLDLAPPGPGEVLVAIEAAGLCHSDLSVVNADRPRPLPHGGGDGEVTARLELLEDRLAGLDAGHELGPGRLGAGGDGGE